MVNRARKNILCHFKFTLRPNKKGLVTVCCFTERAVNVLGQQNSTHVIKRAHKSVVPLLQC